VLSDPETALLVRERTTLPVLVAADFAALRKLYEKLDAKVVLYCNNSPSNFDCAYTLWGFGTSSSVYGRDPLPSNTKSVL